MHATTPRRPQSAGEPPGGESTTKHEENKLDRPAGVKVTNATECGGRCEQPTARRQRQRSRRPHEGRQARPPTGTYKDELTTTRKRGTDDRRCRHDPQAALTLLSTASASAGSTSGVQRAPRTRPPSGCGLNTSRLTAENGCQPPRAHNGVGLTACVLQRRFTELVSFRWVPLGTETCAVKDCRDEVYIGGSLASCI